MWRGCRLEGRVSLLIDGLDRERSQLIANARPNILVEFTFMMQHI
jgi:hypothetical protein